MKKVLSIFLTCILLSATVGPAMAQSEGRGGPMGFIAGCCFGIRAAGDYNEGKEIHWREWVTLVPYVGAVFALWNGIEAAGGMTTAEYSEKYGAMYY